MAQSKPEGMLSPEAFACLAPFVASRVERVEDVPTAPLRAFYTRQNNLIDDFVMLHENYLSPESHGGGNGGKVDPHWYSVNSPHRAAVLSLLGNIAVLVMKVVTVALSGSLAIISTVVDSALDLVSGAVFYLVARSMRVRSDAYPVGKTRYEPLAVIFVATVMGTAALQVIILSVQALAAGASTPGFDTATIALLVLTVVIKVGMYAVCRRIDTPATNALAADHFNDMISNSVALVSVAIAHYVWAAADSLGAIFVSVFIIFNWTRQGMEHVRNLAGHTASPDMLQKVTFVSLHHSDEIVAIEAVRGYGFGTDLLVEVDIVLPVATPLYEAHDIGESLQHRLEHIEGVERAFVHIDYTLEQPATTEHRDVYGPGPAIKSLLLEPPPPSPPPGAPSTASAAAGGGSGGGGEHEALQFFPDVFMIPPTPAADDTPDKLLSDSNPDHVALRDASLQCNDASHLTPSPTALSARLAGDEHDSSRSKDTSPPTPRRTLSESAVTVDTGPHHIPSTAILIPPPAPAPPPPPQHAPPRHHWRSVGSGRLRALLPPIHTRDRPPSRQPAPPLAHWGPLTPPMPRWAALVPPAPHWAPVMTSATRGHLVSTGSPPLIASPRHSSPLRLPLNPQSAATAPAANTGARARMMRPPATPAHPHARTHTPRTIATKPKGRGEWGMQLMWGSDRASSPPSPARRSRSKSPLVSEV